MFRENHMCAFMYSWDIYSALWAYIPVLLCKCVLHGKVLESWLQLAMLLWQHDVIQRSGATNSKAPIEELNQRIPEI